LRKAEKKKSRVFLLSFFCVILAPGFMIFGNPTKKEPAPLEMMRTGSEVPFGTGRGKDQARFSGY